MLWLLPEDLLGIAHATSDRRARKKRQIQVTRNKLRKAINVDMRAASAEIATLRGKVRTLFEQAPRFPQSP